MFGFRRSLVQSIVLLLWALKYWTFGNDFAWYILAVTLTLAVFLTLGTYDHDYWSQRGVFSPPALPFLGHIGPLLSFKDQTGNLFKRYYDTYKNERFIGIHQFFARTLIVHDPELIRRVCVNDFHHFTDRGFYYHKDVDPMVESLVFLRGTEWRKLRTKISPTFSPNKLRGMYPIIENVADKFLIKIKDMLRIEKNKLRGGEEAVQTDDSVLVNGSRFFEGYTADAIVPCAFGFKSDVMENENHPVAVALRSFYEMTLFNIFQKTVQQLWPAFAMFFRIRIIPKKTENYFYSLIVNVLRSREKGEQAKRSDFIDMMMTLRQEGGINDAKTPEPADIVITDMLIAANAFILLLGGFETSSSTLAFMVMELAAHPDIQEKMRAEIREVMERHGGTIGYEALQELTYMDMVIQETLRLYPPFPFIQRECTKDYIIPDTQVTIEKGTTIFFPTLGLHRDEKYFKDGDSFVPERWASGDALPAGVYMPFGDGPRYCIGKRFGSMQMKCCMARILQHVQFKPAMQRCGPFPADPRSPQTLHPADSRVRLTLIQT
ncbi:cytochrome P450 6B1-like [Achroia grisella]|uniref:cytochrome P450 6B1-like n=1 Tax=Achroia grisella TaxID=688607 RepID=UPI0027D27B08|nr:cytochrome P450 6B1-like [Achroia grisella]